MLNNENNEQWDGAKKTTHAHTRHTRIQYQISLSRSFVAKTDLHVNCCNSQVAKWKPHFWELQSWFIHQSISTGVRENVVVLSFQLPLVCAIQITAQSRIQFIASTWTDIECIKNYRKTARISISWASARVNYVLLCMNKW